MQTLSLLGRPLHRLGVRLGLVRNGTNTVALGLALGPFHGVSAGTLPGAPTH